MALTHPNVVATPSYFPILRIVQLVLAIIILGLVAYDVNVYDSYVSGGDNVVIGGIGVGLFTSILTIILLTYYLVTSMAVPAFHNRWAVIALEALAFIFWLVTWALYAKITALIKDVENGDDDYVGYCDYSDDVCYKKRSMHTFSKRDKFQTEENTIYTVLALSLIEWLLFVVTFVIFLLTVSKERRSTAPAAAGQPAHTKDMEAQSQPMPSTAAPVQQQPVVQQDQPVHHQGTSVQQVQQPMH